MSTEYEDRNPEKLISNFYMARPTTVPSAPGTWNTLTVEIFSRVAIDAEWVKIGEYKRNYRQLFHTFVPFQKDGKHYALYSRDYTATRVMSLPDCKDLGGEAPEGSGFCPTGYYVPYDPEEGIDGNFGFICGCHWGDDSSWKIQFLDLSQAQEGVVKRDSRLGCIELLGGAETLAKNIEFACWDGVERPPWSPRDTRETDDNPPYPFVEIACKQAFNLAENNEEFGKQLLLPWFFKHPEYGWASYRWIWKNEKLLALAENNEEVEIDVLGDFRIRDILAKLPSILDCLNGSDSGRLIIGELKKKWRALPQDRLALVKEQYEACVGKTSSKEDLERAFLSCFGKR